MGSADSTGMARSSPASVSKPSADDTRVRLASARTRSTRSKSGLPFLPAQRLAQQFAEQAHVVAQGAVRVVRVLRRAHACHGHS